MRKMNDPHVNALHYWVEHDESVDYDNAEPLNYEDELTEVHLEKRELTITPKEHYASAEEARDDLEAFIRNWEFDAAVESGSKRFELKYLNADVIDRNPTPPPPGVIEASVSFRAGSPKVSIRARVGKPWYPSPSEGQRLDSSDPTALAMLFRLDRHHQGRETLAAMTYFCLTVLGNSVSATKGTTETRKAVRDHYSISADLQKKVAALSSEKGGSEARKAGGMEQEFTAEERAFLLAAVKAFTRRVAEKAANPSTELKMITRAHMPPLSKMVLSEIKRGANAGASESGVRVV